MNWPHRTIIIVPEDKITAANAQAAAWDEGPTGDETFGQVRLSPNGLEPRTHTACGAQLTDGRKTRVLAALTNVPFTAVYWESDGWDYETALADAGLQVIPEAS